MARLKVLMLLHELSRTGAPKVALDAMEALADRVEIHLIAGADGPLAERCRRLGTLQVPFAPLPRGRLAWRLEGRRRRTAWSGLARWNPDLLYVNSVMALPLAERLDRELGLPRAPMLLHVHELDSAVARIRDALPHWLIDRPDRYVGASESVTRRLVDFARVPADRVRLVHSFIVTGDPLPAPADTRNPGDGFVIGGAGTLGWAKGLSLWLLAAAELGRMRRDVRFRWVGVPADAPGESFRVRRRLLGLDEVVEEVAPTDRPLEAFAAFDAFLLTSWEDSFPLVVLENMMLGKPVIALPGGGAPEELGSAGIIVPHFDPREIAVALDALLNDAQRRHALGEAARRRVLEHFTDRTCVPRLWQIMQETAGMAPRA